MNRSKKQWNSIKNKRNNNKKIKFNNKNDKNNKIQRNINKRLYNKKNKKEFIVAQSNLLEINKNNFEYSICYIFKLNIKLLNNDVLLCYIDNEVRGISKNNNIVNINNNFYIFSVIYSNNLVNKINFKYYSKNENKILDISDVYISDKINIYGSIERPLQLNVILN